MDLRVRVPGWTAGQPEVVLNGTPVQNAVVPAGSAGGWVVVSRHWQPGDWLTVTLPMSLTFNPAPDNPAVQAVSYGPVVPHHPPRQPHFQVPARQAPHLPITFRP